MEPQNELMSTLPAPIRIAGLPRWRLSELKTYLDEIGALRDGDA